MHNNFVAGYQISHKIHRLSVATHKMRAYWTTVKFHSNMYKQFLQ